MYLKPLFIAGLLLLAGCDTLPSKQTNFLVLEPQKTFDSTPLRHHPDLSIGLGPIRLNDILDRPQVVTHIDSNRVRLDDFQHWAGGLEDNIYRVLQQNLMALLGTDRVTPYPWPRYRKLDYQVGLDILRFDGAPGGEAHLLGLWNLLDGEGRTEYLVKKFDIVEPVEGTGYAKLAAALSRTLGRLSEDIAATIEARLNKREGTTTQ